MNHMKSMAELLHMAAIQQLKVALLGSLAAHVIDLLLAEWMQTKQGLMTTAIQPPQAYTLMPSVHPSAAALIVGVTSSAPDKESVPVEESICQTITRSLKLQSGHMNPMHHPSVLLPPAHPPSQSLALR